MSEVRPELRAELHSILPDAMVHVECWMGMPDPLIATKRPPTARRPPPAARGDERPAVVVPDGADWRKWSTEASVAYGGPDARSAR